jgi:hypothetical protein
MRRCALPVAIVLMALAVACDERSSDAPSSPSGAPVLASITPSQAAVGDGITLKGSGFSARNTGVRIGTGYLNAVTPASDTAIVFSLPAALSACPPGSEVCIALAIPVTPGTYPVSVVNANGTSNALSLQVSAR